MTDFQPALNLMSRIPETPFSERTDSDRLCQIQELRDLRESAISKAKAPKKKAAPKKSPGGKKAKSKIDKAASLLEGLSEEELLKLLNQTS